jgi:hypothetical protein
LAAFRPIFPDQRSADEVGKITVRQSQQARSQSASSKSVAQSADLSARTGSMREQEPGPQVR